MSAMGHNMPPLAERLEIDHASLAQQAAEALALPALDPILVDEDAEAYSERAKALKGVMAMVEKARKGEKDQILKDGRTVDDHFKKLAKPLEDACNAVVAALNAWQRKKLEAEREAQRRAEEEARKAATPFDEEPPPPAPAPQVAARVVSSATGRVQASVSTVWKYELVSLKDVPREYLQLNDAAVKLAVGSGVREIPGIRIYEDVRTAIR